MGKTLIGRSDDSYKLGMDKLHIGLQRTVVHSRSRSSTGSGVRCNLGATQGNP
jgi:hypothetical protein